MNALELDVNYPVTEYKVKAQYRKLAKKYHLDVAVSMYANKNKFVEIDKAKEYLVAHINHANKVLSSKTTTEYSRRYIPYTHRSADRKRTAEEERSHRETLIKKAALEKQKVRKEKENIKVELRNFLVEIDREKTILKFVL